MNQDGSVLQNITSTGEPLPGYAASQQSDPRGPPPSYQKACEMDPQELTEKLMAMTSDPAHTGLEMDSEDFGLAQGKDYNASHKTFHAKISPKVGSERAKVMAAAVAPWTGSSGVTWPFGVRRAAEGSRAMMLQLACPKSIEAATFNVSVVQMPVIVSGDTGAPGDHDNPGVVTTCPEAFTTRQIDLDGRSTVSGTVNPGIGINGSQLFQNAVLMVVYWTNDEDPSISNWDNLPTDRFQAIQFPELFGETPIQVVGMSIKMVNTTREVDLSGDLVIGRQNCPLDEEQIRVTTIGSTQDPSPGVDGARSLVKCMPPSILNPTEALNIQSINTTNKSGFLTVIPMDYTSMAGTNFAKTTSGSVAYFDEMTSWNPEGNGGLGCYEMYAFQGIQSSGTTADWDNVNSCLKTMYTRYRRISTTSTFAIMKGLMPTFSATLSVHINFLMVPTTPKDPVTAFASMQDPLDVDFLEVLSNATYTSPLYSKSDANGFGSFLRGAVSTVSRAISAATPVAHGVLSIASQMPGPIGRAAQTADKTIKAIEHVKDGAKAAARNPVAAAQALQENRGVMRGERGGVHTNGHGGRGAARTVMPKGGRVGVHKESDGGIDIHIPKGRLRRP